MFVTVDERDARPLYQQLVDEIKTLIARGDSRKGRLLPPVRQVASDLGVNLNSGFCLPAPSKRVLFVSGTARGGGDIPNTQRKA